MRVAGLGGEAVGGALDGDGVQAEALGRRVPGLAALEELEGLGVAASVWTASGERTSTAATIDSTWPRLGDSRPLARRRTAITSATSDSIAVTTSPVDGRSSAIRESRRLRDSASAGKRSSASKAAVRRLPWPSLRGGADDGVRLRRAHAARRSGGLGCRQWRGHGSSIGREWLVWSVGHIAAPQSVSAAVDGRLRPPFERGVDAGQRLVAPEQRDGLEDPRRDGRSGDRHPQRLEDLPGLQAALLEHAAQRRLDALGVPRRRQRRQALAPPASSALARLRIAEELLARLGIVDRAVEEEARHRPELVERRHLLLADRDRVAQAAAARSSASSRAVRSSRSSSRR